MNNFLNHVSYFDPPLNDFVNLFYGLIDSIKQGKFFLSKFKMDVWHFIGALAYRKNRCCMCYHKLPQNHKYKEGKGFHWKHW